MNDDNFFKWLAIFIFTFFIGGFGLLFYNEHQNERKVISSERLLVRATAITRPKHVYVDLVDVKTGTRYNHEYVAKHFSSSEVTLGKPFYVTKEVLKYVRKPNEPNTYEIRDVSAGLITTMQYDNPN